MNRLFSALLVSTLIINFAGAALVFAQPHHHEGDFIIGRDDGRPTPTLVLEADPHILSLEEHVPLHPGEGIYEGLWVADDPGWIGLDADEPDEGFFTLLPGHQVSLRRIAFDAGFAMYDPYTGMEILAADGATFLFPVGADGFIHSHLIFAGDGQLGDTWDATFRLADPSGLHLDSQPFTVRFEAVPEPMSLTMLALGGLAALRRRLCHMPTGIGSYSTPLPSSGSFFW